jgi:mannitol/fructose-specific phosphotransferase system IIA component (Ntr-type)
MNLRRHLDPRSIELGFRIETDDLDPEMPPSKRLGLVKERVIGKLAELLEASGRVSKRTKLHLDLLNREKKAGTALGRGIAMPHVRTRQARDLVMAVAVSHEGVDFGAPDGRPVHAFLALVAPAYDDRLYLKVVRHLAELFVADSEAWGPREALLHAEYAEDVYWALRGVS